LCLVAFLFAFPARTFVVEANAATITVNSVSDAGTNGDGLCTLREAILNANADNQSNVDCAGGAGADTINFNGSLANQTITLTSPVGQFSITSSMTINGSAAANLSVSGNNAVRVFNVSTGVVVVMTGFRITGGNGNSFQDGGAIQNFGNLTLNSMTIQTNTARSGGGVYTAGTGNSLTINGGSILGNSATSNGGGINGTNDSIVNSTNVTVSGNTATNNGGGIFVTGGVTLTVTGGSITGNTAANASGGGISSSAALIVTNASITNNHADGSGGLGGGMSLGGGNATITDSTLSGNTSRRGGGIYFISGTHSITGTTLSGNAAASGAATSGFYGGGGLVNSASTVNVSNSTISGNSSGCDCGGGGMTALNGGTTNLRNVTIANNTASAGPGGGINSSLTGLSSGTTNVGNTIVADNTASTNPDVNGAIVSQGFNLVRTRGTSTGYVASDLPNGSNPLLQALANNGGITQTHRLSAGSAAIDAGINALAVNPANGAALTTDQRGTGFPRIIDGNGDFTATVDIGAFEAPLAPTAATASVSGRVVTAQGRGIRNVVITMTDSSGNTRTAISTTFGYYRFEEVAAGQIYIFTARGKRFSFEQNTQVLSILEETNNIDFVADEQTVFSAK
jgi:CSLREA domain-containing protein